MLGLPVLTSQVITVFLLVVATRKLPLTQADVNTSSQAKPGEPAYAARNPFVSIKAMLRPSIFAAISCGFMI